MKKLIYGLIALICFSGFAQDREQKFAFSLFSDPVATFKDGANIGVSQEYQMNVMYFKAQMFLFPNLRGKTLVEMTAVPLGFNYHQKFDDWRVYGGLKLGAIFRDKTAYGTYGGEMGLDIKIGQNAYIGGVLTYDWREDGRFWNVDPYWRGSGFIRYGWKW